MAFGFAKGPLGLSGPVWVSAGRHDHHAASKKSRIDGICARPEEGERGGVQKERSQKEEIEVSTHTEKIQQRIYAHCK